jgi:hypothetical protein
MKERDNLKALINYIGFGNPMGNLWFMGIEEGGESWNSKNNKSIQSINIYKDRYLEKGGVFHLSLEDVKETVLFDPKSDNKSSYLNIVREIINIFYNSSISSNTEIGTKHGNSFLLNLSPLGFSSSDNGFYQESKEIFQINSRNEILSSDIIKDERTNCLKKYFDSYFGKGYEKKQYLFCFGKTYWSCYEKFLIKIGMINDIKALKIINLDIRSRNQVREYKEFISGNITIYLFDHPSYGWLLPEQVKSIFQKK